MKDIVEQMKHKTFKLSNGYYLESFEETLYIYKTMNDFEDDNNIMYLLYNKHKKIINIEFYYNNSNRNDFSHYDIFLNGTIPKVNIINYDLENYYYENIDSFLIDHEVIIV